MSPDGLLLLHKPAGVTSFTALGSVKKKLDTGKVGHTGTLDKFAAGLLVVLAGRWTRLAPFITDMDKTYEAVFEFGQETTTLDPEGEVVFRAPAPDRETLLAALPRFTGHIMQSPPAFSAVHIAGRRAYERALSGEDPAPAARPVNIYAFDVLDYSPPFLSCRVSCGKGTYIRSLARDMGRACTSRAYVKELKRTHVGPFRLEDAVNPDTFDAARLQSGRGILEKLIPGPALTVKAACVTAVKNGNPLRRDFFEPEEQPRPRFDTDSKKTTSENPWTSSDAEKTSAQAIFPVFGPDGEFLALAEKKGGGFAYRFVCG